MTKRILAAVLAVILTLSLAACGDSGNTPSASLPSASSGDDSVLGTDFQKNMHQSTSVWIYALCETENGYYFEYGSFVYFMDKKTGATTILCGKPDCAHDDESCNAYIGSTFLTYYDGKLYYTNGNYVSENGTYVNKGLRLYSMGLDGTSHDVVQELEFVPGGNTNSYVTVPIIYNETVYFAYSGQLYAVPLGADINQAVLIYGEELEENGNTEYKNLNINELYYELWADGDNVYFMAKNVQQSDGTYKDTLFRCNVQTYEIEEVWKVPDEADVGTWETTGVSATQWYISDGYIYFYLSGNGIWYTELSTGETVKLTDVDAPAGVASFSDEYIIVIGKEAIEGIVLIGPTSSGGDTLYVYDYDGKLVNELSLEQIYKDNGNTSDCSVLWAADGKVYINADASIASTTYDGVTTTAGVQDQSIYFVDIDSGSVEKTDWSFYG